MPDEPKTEPITKLSGLEHGTPEYDSCRAYINLIEKLCGRTLTKSETDDVLYETNLINNSSRPSVLWSTSETAEEEDRKLFGEKFIEDLIKPDGAAYSGSGLFGK